MDIDFTSEDEAYRTTVRSWFAANYESGHLKGDPMAALDAACAWQRRLYDAGYIGMSWPKRFGGHEAPITHQAIVSEEMARLGIPPPINLVGLSVVGPTLIRYGSPTQQDRFLGAILRAEELWCQGFSEPGAGSDLASLSTKGEVREEGIRVTGQKIWTSLGTVADWCFALVRTNPRMPKHEGITCLIVDMNAPDVEARAIRNAAGGMHFAEVFFDNVLVPHDHVIGAIGGGWPMVRASLDHERSGLSTTVSLERYVAELVDLCAEEGRDGGLWLDVAQHWAEVRALRFRGYQTLSEQLAGGGIGPEAAMGKLFASELRQRITRTAMAALGCDSPISRAEATRTARRWQHRYMDGLAHTIGGGTSQIMRNVIADRVLGLPRADES